MSGFDSFMRGAAWGCGLVLTVVVSPVIFATLALLLIGAVLEALGFLLAQPSRYGLRLFKWMVAEVDALAPGRGGLCPDCVITRTGRLSPCVKHGAEELKP